MTDGKSDTETRHLMAVEDSQIDDGHVYLELFCPKSEFDLDRDPESVVVIIGEWS